jgi:uncharacterized damage-inducible protein DinB
MGFLLTQSSNERITNYIQYSFFDYMYEDLIQQIRDFPDELEAVLRKVNTKALDLPIREGAWTVRQSINHLVDSHVNSYIRVKFALSEDNPTIMAYNEEKWAEMFDTRDMDIQPTIGIITGLHRRIVFLLEKLDESDWTRTLNHSETGQMTLADYVKIVANHGSGHLNSVKKVVSS